MAKHYTGPSDTSDFDDLTPDNAAHKLRAYQLLGEAFEDEDAAGMDGRGWLIDDPLALIEGRHETEQKVRRELRAAVGLALHQGKSWSAIAEVLKTTPAEARAKYGQ